MHAEQQLLMTRHPYDRDCWSNMEIINELASNPLLAVGTSLFAFIVLAIVARLVQNTLIGTKPPIYEDIPFIGGLLKFMQARKLADLSPNSR
jgi:hypothetical protein